MAGILLCIIYFLFESFFCSDELDENEKLGEGLNLRKPADGPLPVIREVDY